MSLIILLLICFSVHATESLEQIEVTASKQSTNYNFTQTETVNAEDFETLPAPFLSQALERVPGLTSSQNGGPGGRTTFFIRGTESRHISFTLDGLKLNDPSSTDRQFDAAFLSLTGIEEIRVHKGPQAVLFGSDAMGGHVEMLTRKGSDKPEKKLTLNAGSFGTLGATYQHDWSKGTLSFVKQRTDGISRFNEKRFGATERDGSETTQLMSSSRHEFFNKTHTDLLGSFVEGRNELDITSDNGSEHGLSRQYLVQQKTSYQASKENAFSLRTGLNRNERSIKSLTTGTTDFAGNLFQNELLYENGNDDRRILAGVVGERETLQVDKKKSFDLGGIFLQGLKRLGDFTLQGGLRGDHHSRYGNFGTGSAGVEMKKNIGTFGVQYSRGYKAPSLFQLFDPNFGNDDLKPEINQSSEASWKKKFKSFDAEFVAFQSKLSNLIVFTGSGYRNQGRFISEGVEPSLKWTGEKFQLRGSYTHLAFREVEVPVLRRPYNSGQFSASWFPSDISELFARLRWYDSRKDVDFNGKTVKLNSFETMDVGAVYRMGRHTFSAQIVNITNREYEEIFGFSVMPRSVFGNYSVTF
ncbi:MAG: TonB-dependent receptor plug domain-containing protein [Bacteriovoracaceae bacterium]